MQRAPRITAGEIEPTSISDRLPSPFRKRVSPPSDFPQYGKETEREQNLAYYLPEYMDKPRPKGGVFLLQAGIIIVLSKTILKITRDSIILMIKNTKRRG